METLYKHIKGDKAIWLVVLFLAIASTLLVYSSIVTLAYRHHGGNTFFYLLRHGFFVFAGVGIIYLVHRMKYTYFSRLAQLALYASGPLLLITLLFGVTINGAARWLNIPIINQTFQTSDFAKLALMMFLARRISQKQPVINDWTKSTVQIILPIVMVCGLILPADLSTSALVFFSSLVLMFVGGVPKKHLLALIGIGIISLTLVYGVGKAFPGSFDRLDTWISRIENFGEGDSKGNYQIEQSKIAAATGGFTGKGPGNSTQRHFLPHPYSDFIFAIVLEEYGLIGGLGMLLLYLILFFRCVKIVNTCPKHFGALLVFGISFMLVLQAFINMGVAVDILPVTGQPLPLVSMGGTSIWFTCISMGIILSVSRSLELETENVKSGKNNVVT